MGGRLRLRMTPRIKPHTAMYHFPDGPADAKLVKYNLHCTVTTRADLEKYPPVSCVDRERISRFHPKTWATQVGLISTV